MIRHAGVAEPADATDLRKLECSPRETGDAELPKFGETCDMAIPSQARPEHSSREGVETRRAAPKPRIFRGDGEGIVQTANLTRVTRNVASGRRKP